MKLFSSQFENNQSIINSLFFPNLTKEFQRISDKLCINSLII